MSTRNDIPSPDWLLDREFEKHERLRALLLLARHFDTPHYWKAVGNVWTHNESLFQDLDLLDELWSGAGHHDASMRHLAMSRDDRERFRTLPETLTVWRGCYRKNLAGWSWTLDRDQALFFSTRYVPDGRPLIAEAEVSRQDVLAFFGGGGEEEVVIRPVSLRDVTITGLPRMQLCKQAEHASLLYHLSQTGKFSLENNKAARPS